MNKFSYISILFLAFTSFANFVQAGTGNLQTAEILHSVDIYEVFLSTGIMVDTTDLANHSATKNKKSNFSQSNGTRLNPDRFLLETAKPTLLPVLENDEIAMEFQMEVIKKPAKGKVNVVNKNLSYIPSGKVTEYIDTITYKVSSIHDPEIYFTSEAIVEYKGLKTGTLLENFRVYPNPTSSYINIFLPGKKLIEYEIVIMDPSGKEILHKKNVYSSFPFRFSVENLEKGIYLVNIITEEDSTSRKIVVN